MTMPPKRLLNHFWRDGQAVLVEQDKMARPIEGKLFVRREMYNDRMQYNIVFYKKPVSDSYINPEFLHYATVWHCYCKDEIFNKFDNNNLSEVSLGGYRWQIEWEPDFIPLQFLSLK